MGYAIPNNCAVMYLGNIEEVVQRADRYLAKILLKASRKAITRNWYKAEPPGKDHWFEIVRDIKRLVNNMCEFANSLTSVSNVS